MALAARTARPAHDGRARGGRALARAHVRDPRPGVRIANAGVGVGAIPVAARTVGDAARIPIYAGFRSEIRSRVQVLVQCAAATRDHLMECMANGLGRLTEQQRVRAMADTMSAVSELPSEQRRAFIAKMTAMAV